MSKGFIMFCIHTYPYSNYYYLYLAWLKQRKETHFHQRHHITVQHKIRNRTALSKAGECTVKAITSVNQISISKNPQNKNVKKGDKGVSNTPQSKLHWKRMVSF